MEMICQQLLATTFLKLSKNLLKPFNSIIMKDLLFSILIIFLSMPFYNSAIAQCDTPGGVVVGGITNTMVQVSWQPVSSALYYEIRYRPTGGSWETNSTNAPIFTIVDLMATSEYEVEVRTKCDFCAGESWSAWSTLQSFIPEDLPPSGNNNSSCAMWEGDCGPDSDIWRSGKIGIGTNPSGLYKVSIDAGGTGGGLNVNGGIWGYADGDAVHGVSAYGGTNGVGIYATSENGQAAVLEGDVIIRDGQLTTIENGHLQLDGGNILIGPLGQRSTIFPGYNYMGVKPAMADEPDMDFRFWHSGKFQAKRLLADEWVNTNSIDAQHYFLNGVEIDFSLLGASPWVNGTNGISYTNGQVGIGTGTFDSPNFNLYVTKGIKTEEVLVELCNGWCDYVFEPTYALATLEEVDQHIQEKGHLPNMPAEHELEEQGGVKIGEMTYLQQEKIEEAFLHLIEMNKQIKEMQSQMDALKSENLKLRNELQEINAGK